MKTQRALTPQNARYSATTIWLHWIVAVLLVGNWVLGASMAEMDRSVPARGEYYAWHKSIGVTIFTLVCIRVLWRWIGRARARATQTEHEKRHWTVVVGHGALYVLMFAVPLSGYFGTLAAGYKVSVFNVFTLPVLIAKNPALSETLHFTHEVLGWGLAVGVALHIAAAAKHYFWDRDGTLAHMLPRAR